METIRIFSPILALLLHARGSLGQVCQDSTDPTHNCPIWASENINNCAVPFIMNLCPLSCGICTTGPFFECTPLCPTTQICAPPTSNVALTPICRACADDPGNVAACAAIGATGGCTDPVNRAFLTSFCPQTCSFCDPTPTGPCTPNPCANGQCFPNGNLFVCQCPPGVTGTLCDQVIPTTTLAPATTIIVTDPCAAAPCQNGGVCVPAGTAYTCNCPAGTQGTNCENQVLCPPGRCLNGGQCRLTGTTQVCDCPDGFVGDVCQTDACNTRPRPCGDGTCMPVAGGFRCVCPAGSFAPDCIRNLCTPNPCLNNGDCEMINFGFICRCRTGFSGRYCNIGNACTPQSCQNGGTCSISNQAIICTCPLGYTGTRCEIFTPCVGNPCSPGSCSAGTGGNRVCSCPDGRTTNTDCTGGGVGPGPQTCANVYSDGLCASLVQANRCNTHTVQMLQNCRLACRVCGPNAVCLDFNRFCPSVARAGQCIGNSDISLVHCRSSCNQCGGGGPVDPPVPPGGRSCQYFTAGSACRDMDPLCRLRQGDCAVYPRYFQPNCARTCGCCTT